MTGHMTSLLFEYLSQTNQYDLGRRQFIAVLIKNIVKKAFGQHTFTHYED